MRHNRKSLRSEIEKKVYTKQTAAETVIEKKRQQRMNLFLYVPIEAVKIAAANGDINIASFRVRTFCLRTEKNYTFTIAPVGKCHDVFQYPVGNIMPYILAHYFKLLLLLSYNSQ